MNGYFLAGLSNIRRRSLNLCLAFENECGKFFISGIDTKNRSDIPVIIGPDERWTLAYAINAENAKPIEFSLDLSIEDSAVMVKRKRDSREVPKSRRSPQKRET